jgi:hypothetical protein
MFRTIGDGPSVWESALPAQVQSDLICAPQLVIAEESPAVQIN